MRTRWVYMYPPLFQDGWHMECVLDLKTWGFGVCLSWNTSYVVWIGPFAFLAWDFSPKPSPWLETIS